MSDDKKASFFNLKIILTILVAIYNLKNSKTINPFYPF